MVIEYFIAFKLNVESLKTGLSEYQDGTLKSKMVFVPSELFLLSHYPDYFIDFPIHNVMNR